MGETPNSSSFILPYSRSQTGNTLFLWNLVLIDWDLGKLSWRFIEFN